MNHERNSTRSKVSMLALNASVQNAEHRAYHTVFVHRSGILPNVYLDVSKSSIARVMRAMSAIVAGNTSR